MEEAFTVLVCFIVVLGIANGIVMIKLNRDLKKAEQRKAEAKKNTHTQLD